MVLIALVQSCRLNRNISFFCVSNIELSEYLQQVLITGSFRMIEPAGGYSIRNGRAMRFSKDIIQK